jgi:hypothetical protein
MISSCESEGMKIFCVILLLKNIYFLENPYLSNPLPISSKTIRDYDKVSIGFLNNAKKF